MLFANSNAVSLCRDVVGKGEPGRFNKLAGPPMGALPAVPVPGVCPALPEELPPAAPAPPVVGSLEGMPPMAPVQAETPKNAATAAATRIGLMAFVESLVSMNFP
jgi:hypothetical protein